MKVEMLMDWGGYSKGAVVEVNDEEGCRMIGTAVAFVVEPTKPAKGEPAGHMVEEEKKKGKK